MVRHGYGKVPHVHSLSIREVNQKTVLQLVGGVLLLSQYEVGTDGPDSASISPNPTFGRRPRSGGWAGAISKHFQSRSELSIRSKGRVNFEEYLQAHS